jgi:hypothetical protein
MDIFHGLSLIKPLKCPVNFTFSLIFTLKFSVANHHQGELIQCSRAALAASAALAQPLRQVRRPPTPPPPPPREAGESDWEDQSMGFHGDFMGTKWHISIKYCYKISINMG